MNQIRQANQQSLMHRMWKFWKWPLIISSAIMFFSYLAQPKATKHQKLDYSKPIITAEGTIVCPESVLIDELHLFNFEPIAAIALLLAFVNYGNHHLVLGITAIAVFASTRIYYFYLAYIAFQNIHKLSRRRERSAFIFGFFPSALVSAAVQCGVFSLLAFMATGGLD